MVYFQVAIPLISLSYLMHLCTILGVRGRGAGRVDRRPSPTPISEGGGRNVSSRSSSVDTHIPDQRSRIEVRGLITRKQNASSRVCLVVFNARKDPVPGIGKASCHLILSWKPAGGKQLTSTRSTAPSTSDLGTVGHRRQPLDFQRISRAS